MYLYIAVTKDEYEFPIAVAETVPELAKMMGVTANSIYSNLSHTKHGRVNNSGYRKVCVEDGER